MNKGMMELLLYMSGQYSGLQRRIMAENDRAI